MCAIHAARRGLGVLLLEKNAKPGMKILISGGGRCNFTNLLADPRENYLSDNPHFCIAAMSRYTPWDFIDMVEKHQIGYHEKTLGQQFCDESSKQILKMLLDECEQAGVKIKLSSEVTDISTTEHGFVVQTQD
ncbi:MAG: NAD(P)/FAD-dependent oxidoreductase, partial [Pseudomonadales bacterium]